MPDEIKNNTNETTGNEAKEVNEAPPGNGEPEAETPPSPEPVKEEKKGRKKPTNTIGKVLVTIRTSIQNAKLPGSFFDYIKRFGFNGVRLGEGESMVTTTETARTNQLNANATRMQVYRDFKSLKKAAQLIYRHHRVIGQEIFRGNTHLRDKLGLSGALKEIFGDWIGQTMQLYDNLDTPGVLEGYASFNITPEALAAGKQAVLDAEAGLAAKKKAKADAEKATELKNKAYKELLSWWSKFLKVVHIALEEDPQLKEQVHIIVPFLK